MVGMLWYVLLLICCFEIKFKKSWHLLQSAEQQKTKNLLEKS